MPTDCRPDENSPVIAGEAPGSLHGHAGASEPCWSMFSLVVTEEPSFVPRLVNVPHTTLPAVLTTECWRGMCDRRFLDSCFTSIEHKTPHKCTVTVVRRTEQYVDDALLLIYQCSLFQI